jgi:hypothetical protein
MRSVSRFLSVRYTTLSGARRYAGAKDNKDSMSELSEGSDLLQYKQAPEQKVRKRCHSFV